MKILIVTQKVDTKDDNLGFFYRWIEEFSRHCGEVSVIAGAVGTHSPSAKIKIMSLGKEEGAGRVKRIVLFLKHFWDEFSRSDAVFFHMCPEFVLASAPFLIFSKKPRALWYVHKSVTWKLKLAERLVDWIFTASDLSFRLPSKKVVYTGHAIDTVVFRPISNSQFPISNFGLRLLTAGRISPVKDLETVIRACVVLKNTWQRSWSLTIAGGPYMPRDHEYLVSLKSLAKENGLENLVIFEGSHPYTEMPELYSAHDVFLSMSTTGSIDKSVLEAMSSGLTVICANEAFQSLLPPRYFLEKRNPEFLAARVKIISDEPRPNTALRNLVTEKHSLQNTIKTILDAYSRL